MKKPTKELAIVYAIFALVVAGLILAWHCIYTLVGL
jgi:hypothetical protein